MKMKKNILLAVFIGFSIVMIGFNAWGTPIVDLTLDSSDLTVGDTFNVLVSASGVSDDDLLSFGFDLVFDATEFTFTSATIGADFMDDSDLLANTDVAGSVFEAIGGDDILLATLSFTANMEGENLSLGIFGDIFTGVEGLITYSLDPIDITQNIAVSVDSSTTQVPEPATVVLVFMGLMSMIGFRNLNNRVV